MKTLIIYNPHSGRVSIEKEIDNVILTLQKYQITDVSLFTPTNPKDITRYLLENASRFELLILFGGDGTLNEAMNGLMPLTVRPKLLYVPNGTVNDVGHMLGLSKNYKKTLRLLGKEPTYMDVCQMEDNYFTYVAGCGKFTSVSYETKHFHAKKIFGKMYYYWKAMKEIASPIKMHLSVTNGKEIVEGNYYLMLAMNSQRIGNFYVHRKKNVKLDDNQISVLLFDANRFASVFSMFRFFVFGDYLKYGITELVGSDFYIQSKEPIQYNQDGEKSLKKDSIHISVHSKAIQIYVSDKSKKKYFIEKSQ